MNPEYVHRMDGEGPIPGTRQYTDAFGLGGQMYGASGYGMPGMYGQGFAGRGSWYGR